MTTERMIEIMSAALNDVLCEGCDEKYRDFDHETFGSCCECRSITAQRIAEILREPEEVIPHRNYEHPSDYWCKCGEYLGKKGDVVYCSHCGRKIKWDGGYWYG